MYYTISLLAIFRKVNGAFKEEPLYLFFKYCYTVEGVQVRVEVTVRLRVRSIGGYFSKFDRKCALSWQ